MVKYDIAFKLAVVEAYLSCEGYRTTYRTTIHSDQDWGHQLEAFSKKNER